MKAKHQQLIFDKGITFVPSNAVCSDNALSEERGMIYEEGEHKVIQHPVKILEDVSALSNLVHVHTYNNEKRYIYVAQRLVEGEEGPQDDVIIPVLVWGEIQNGEMTLEGDLISSQVDVDKIKVTTVGKALIVSYEDGLHYYLWKENTYKSLGQNIPMQKMTFTMQNTAGAGLRYDEITNSLKCDGIFNAATRPTTVKGDKHEDFNNLVVGLYVKNKKSVANTKRFCRPFLIRTALRLYDDSYIHISQPILMLPCMTENSVLSSVVENTATMNTYCRSLKYQNESFTSPATGEGSFYEDWTDIVKDIVIFITPGVEIYDLSVDQPISMRFNFGNTQTVDGVIVGGTSGSTGMTLAQEQKQGCAVLAKRSKEDIAADIAASSVFYKLCSVGLFEKNDHMVDDKIDTHYLENLETHELLDVDDYFSNCTLHSETMYSYNGRLNLANVKRSVFEGYDYFMPFAGFGVGGAIGSGYTGYCRFYVTVETDSGSKVIKHEAYAPNYQGVYFFYPDSRAKHVQIFREYGQTHSASNPYHRLLDADLKEHNGLHGAYYFKGMPTVTQDTHETYNTTAAEPTADENVLETLASYIVTSDVNNPFVFRPEGYNKVGNGFIMGMSTQTQALSQGQFGQFPLIVFTSEGIWAMTVDDTGLYSSIHPLSRDVCSNPASITQTDGAVYFASDKGLMVVAGSQVKCVSEQLSGKTDNFTLTYTPMNFASFLKTCFTAYDYKNSRIWLFGGPGSPTNNSWVYSIKSGTFSRSTFYCDAAVNDYPDYLLSKWYLGIYSFEATPDIEQDTEKYDGLLITRPLKLENAVALKSIMQVKHIYNIENMNVAGENNPYLDFRIYGSNNLSDWAEVHSLTGTPWKYYRFKYWLPNLKATDRFSGTIIETQERRVNKLR